jgi:hypothetical protein
VKPAWAGKRRDANEPDILDGLRKCGFEHWRLNDPCDALIWPRAGGKFGLIEIKDPSKPPSQRQLTGAQKLFFEVSEGCPRAKVETFDEALAFAESLR